MKCREFLRALVTVRLGLSEFKINRSALDAAYNQVFPDSKPLNVRKRKKPPAREHQGHEGWRIASAMRG